MKIVWEPDDVRKRVGSSIYLNREKAATLLGDSSLSFFILHNGYCFFPSHSINAAEMADYLSAKEYS